MPLWPGQAVSSGSAEVISYVLGREYGPHVSKLRFKVVPQNQRLSAVFQTRLLFSILPPASSPPPRSIWTRSERPNGGSVSISSSNGAPS